MKDRGGMWVWALEGLLLPSAQELARGCCLHMALRSQGLGYRHPPISAKD